MILQDTGERHIITNSFSNKAELYNHFMHLARYRFTEKYIKNKRVLDFGCGSGYGSFELSRVAESVVAVDISPEAVEYARSTYKNDNLTYCLVSEINAQKFDIITSFQVIEHVKNDRQYLQKLKSLLADDGLLIISTPDKTLRLFNRIQKPWNLFHIKEYSAYNLNKLLSTYFSEVQLLKIGSDRDFVRDEIQRCKKLRIVTLPCTLIIFPIFLRNQLLKSQSDLYNFLSTFRSHNKRTNTPKEDNIKSDYCIEDIKFEEQLLESTDILAICKI